jgi:hypothetical protein
VTLAVWNMKPALAAVAFRVTSSCHIFRMGFSHLLSWLDLWWHRQSLQIYQKNLILSVLLALGCPCGHLQLQDVASLLIFGPSQVFACELKLHLKFCTICKLAHLDQQEQLWFQFTCMCRMMLKFTEAEIIYGHVQPSISSFIIYIFTSRPAISRVTICLLLCEKLG